MYITQYQTEYRIPSIEKESLILVMEKSKIEAEHILILNEI